MSRIGRRPIAAIKGVKIERKGTHLKVTGPKGELQAEVPASISFEVGEAHVLVKRASDNKGDRVLHGTWRALLANMMRGVSDGFQRKLEIVGVGYKAEKRVRALQLTLGYSHPVSFPLPEGIDAELESPTVIRVTGTDKELVGETAARIRRLRKPDVYKNKGIRYRGERLIKKVGKAGGK